MATHAYDVKQGELLEMVERMELDEVDSASLERGISQEEAERRRGWQSELFSVLSLLTKGEANQLARSCEDKNGSVAWKKLYDRFKTKTPATLAAAWRDTISPRAIDALECKVVEHQKEHGEEAATGMAASLLLEILPDQVQPVVAQGLSSTKLVYDTLEAKIKLTASLEIAGNNEFAKSWAKRNTEKTDGERERATWIQHEQKHLKAQARWSIEKTSELVSR